MVRVGFNYVMYYNINKYQNKFEDCFLSVAPLEKLVRVDFNYVMCYNINKYQNKFEDFFLSVAPLEKVVRVGFNYRQTPLSIPCPNLRCKKAPPMHRTQFS